ncbi:MAG: BBP7 family outer membrane beta-barrel protein [Planctomycetota bacterium]|jgi:hypothetical protein
MAPAEDTEAETAQTESEPKPPPTTDAKPEAKEQKRRLRIAIEGLIAFWENAQGPFGEHSGQPDQMLWDILGSTEAPGFRLGGMYEVDANNSVEARWTWFTGIEQQGRQTGVFGFSPGDGGAPGVSASNTATFNRKVEVMSFEASWWRLLPDVDKVRANFLLGVRVIPIDEEASAVDWANDFGAGSDPFVRSDVSNTFAGGQVGVAVVYAAGTRVEFVGILKGLFGAMLRDISVVDQAIFSGGLHAGSLEETDLVFGVDLDLGLRVWVSRRIAVTLGYNLLFVDGVVHASAAQDFTQSATGAVQPRVAKDELVLHSVLLGVIVDF